MTNLNKEVNEAIEKLEEEITELQSHIDFINSIDFTKPVNEKMWHEICKTPLRNSNEVLSQLVKNIFPQATNIKVGCNWVVFKLLEFNIQIPTSWAKGINIDLSWYRPLKKPVFELNYNIQIVKEYLELVDNKKAKWYELASKRLPRSSNKFLLFFKWYFWYKWENLNSLREKVETAIQEEKTYFEKNTMQKYKKEKELLNQKIQTLFFELLPMIECFSIVHKNYNDDCCCIFTLEDIKNKEKDVLKNIK